MSDNIKCLFRTLFAKINSANSNFNNSSAKINSTKHVVFRGLIRKNTSCRNFFPQNLLSLYIYTVIIRLSAQLLLSALFE